ncbi:DUF488 domain-containing protein [Mesorhizobium sp. LHD-90]|uniref:DUF488 domain-containing protein n=1 Tax=Mesorhizobium sp. LHD-90 TaxID=3071414 RepID=UPI0027E08B33|nr:DUF488 domain-containing protein [Mesorhizobium sp. LHD-90]MDQ6435416.1 DUF488 domain-containing protein [Mesorhizobium sp. LHD-90]
MLHLKRAYEPPSSEDGFRILVDRLWPRGLAKADAAIELWLKEIAPSTELRRWFGHDPEKWQEFRRRYSDELDRNAEAVETLRQAIAGKDKVTLLYAAHDDEHNNAVALLDYLTASEK